MWVTERERGFFEENRVSRRWRLLFCDAVHQWINNFSPLFMLQIGAAAFHSWGIHVLRLYVHHSWCLPKVHASLLFINDVKPLSSPFPPPPPPTIERENELWRDKSFLDEERKAIISLTLLCRNEGSFSPPGSQSVHTHTLTNTVTLTFTCTWIDTLSLFLSPTHETKRKAVSQACARCRLPLAWESLMRSSLQAEAHTAISNALCWGWFISGFVTECWLE